jgi:hypothetical protein
MDFPSGDGRGPKSAIESLVTLEISAVLAVASGAEGADWIAAIVG